MISITECNTNNTSNQFGKYEKKVRYMVDNGEGDDWGDVEVESLVG